MIAAAERRARSIGVGAEHVLICADALTEEAYLTALADSLGTSYQALDDVSRSACPINDDQLIHAAKTGLLPLREGHDLVWIIAPRGFNARRLADPNTPLPARFRLTSSDQLCRFVTRHGQRALGQRATDELRRTRPLFSSAPRSTMWRITPAIAFVTLTAAMTAVAPTAVIEALSATLCMLFLTAAALRMSSALFMPKTSDQRRDIGDDRLPIYTIICALYREAAVVKKLVTAIRALDYPPEKLDVKFVIEGDDPDTRRALAELELGPPFEIITAPPIGPRTKPKALNVALPLARGEFTVVYDAEDVPEPDQLRRAVDAFAAAGPRLACVQASLTIDNTADNWLAGMFTADYAGQFDVFLPGLAALHLPFPLGGSSNHFRTATLRSVGGWDPHNVTEDADLGIRLRRLGHGSTVLPSTTYEEAPVRLTPWLKQRTRWYKGWMQTWFVHMRRPVRLFRDLGTSGALAFQLFFSCNVLAALIHPVFMAALGVALFAMPKAWAAHTMSHVAPVFAVTLLSGYASTVVVDLIGLRRRRMLAHAWVLVLTPIYWFLLSLAAWRAVFQLLDDPQRWEKTEHGLAKTSRKAAARMSGLRIAKAEHRPTASGPSSTFAPVGPMRIMHTARGPMIGTGG